MRPRRLSLHGSRIQKPNCRTAGNLIKKGDPVMKNESPAENEQSVDETSQGESDFLDSIPGWSEDRIERYKKLYKNTVNRDGRIEWVARG